MKLQKVQKVSRSIVCFIKCFSSTFQIAIHSKQVFNPRKLSWILFFFFFSPSWGYLYCALWQLQEEVNTVEQGSWEGRGTGVRASPVWCVGLLWDLCLDGSGRVWQVPQWKRYFVAGLRLMYVAFISSASGFCTSLNRSPLVLTIWLSMYRISFLGASLGAIGR